MRQWITTQSTVSNILFHIKSFLWKIISRYFRVYTMGRGVLWLNLLNFITATFLMYFINNRQKYTIDKIFIFSNVFYFVIEKRLFHFIAQQLRLSHRRHEWRAIWLYKCLWKFNVAHCFEYDFDRNCICYAQLGQGKIIQRCNCTPKPICKVSKLQLCSRALQCPKMRACTTIFLKYSIPSKKRYYT